MIRPKKLGRTTWLSGNDFSASWNSLNRSSWTQNLYGPGVAMEMSNDDLQWLKYFIFSMVLKSQASAELAGCFWCTGYCTPVSSTGAGKRSFPFSCATSHELFRKTKGQQNIFTFYSPETFVPEGEALFMLPFMDPRAPAFVLLLGKRNRV